ncbi:SMI1/KNR4 family protein [Polyangium jinanense]|uniref:SMI1/KNR4 family protein n=1 Tax=Polyangium jinanense TaxID=2829994 RepID=A0A9X4AVV8_9BACT|nr:SMI1/KNR4 family protein [Polyangium jinanense]MDC3959508.1 SMI1/KNR4 family protein [Polyangium jinanense]MDC3986106.1 SMI1/KNR4 family protein [Polyangium jinanense]
MRMETENPHGATSPEEIAGFQARWSVVLPAEYREFLLKSNGGWPEPDTFVVPGWHGQASMLDAFFGIHHGRETERLDRAMEVYDARIPGDLIPIADDAGGNVVCIGWKGKRRGKIYFWDHEDELDEQGLSRQDYRNVYLLANSLTEFLNNLREEDDDQCE